MEVFSLILVALAAMAAGAINAIAGGGTLITFPTLVALGLPAVSANVTNTVALVPGYLGATFAQLKDIKGQEKRLAFLLPAGVIGGLTGGLLLLNTTEKVFQALVPFLILLASGLLAVQDPLRAWLVKRAAEKGHKHPSEAWAALPVGVAGIYGGYFGAGLSVIVLAVLGLVLDDNLTRLNGLKQIIGFAINVAAATLFIFSGQVNWLIAAVMAVGALIGGALGGRVAGRIKPATLRKMVVTVGVIISILYFIRYY